MASWVGAGLVLVACATEANPTPPEATGQVSSAAFANGGFETGAANVAPPNWTLNQYVNHGITAQTPQTVAGLDLVAGGVANTVTLAAAAPLSQPDPALATTTATLRWPRYGKQCAIINGQNAAATYTTGANQNVNELSQTMTVGATDVDPSDGQVHIRFAVAPVLMNPAHTAVEQPYYMVVVTNVTKATILYSDFNLSGAGIPWQTQTVAGNVIDYTDWQLIDVAPGAAGIAMGDQIKLQLYASGCSLGAHWGELYVDGVGATVPGLSVEGTGPAQANAGANLTYNFTYQNGSPATACTTSANCTPNTEACVGGFCAETAVSIPFTVPAGTTFVSITPPPGATCTGPNAAGTITCTFTNPVGPGASGTFSITVNVDAATTGQVTCGSYQIQSTQETALVGPQIITSIGCALDSQCPAGNWCDEALKDCEPTLANGVAIPTDTGHVAPQTVLNGKCTAAAGALVCTSKVCDAKDNACGYENGDGPCTPANGGVVCQSGACSNNLLCMPLGGCNVDA